MNFSTRQIARTRRTIDDLAARVASAPSTMLAVWAHPDDESYLGAGLMSEVARRGGRVVSVTATLGEHGTDDPVRNRPQALATRRRAELFSALDILGIDTGIVLGFGDGACDRIPDRVGARHIAAIIEDVRPDAVLGFGDDGVTGHPDHCAIARWTRLAVADHDERIPLVTVATGAAWPDDLLPRMHEIGVFWPGFPLRDAGGPTWQPMLDDRQIEQKLAALASHGSQIGPLHDVLGADDYRRLVATESYRAANRAAHELMFADRLHRAA
jgi:LmbE family N-acetylglucosaminyl deacetylase